MDEATIIMLVIRLLMPLIILRFPLIGILLCAGSDVVDYPYLGTIENYQLLDKLLDTYYLSFAAIAALRWKDIWVRRIALGAYVWRVIGVALLFATDQRWLLMVFPNFFEMFFIFYLLYIHLSKRTQLISSNAIAGIIIFILLIPKMVQEYILHVYQPSPQSAPNWITYLVEHFAWTALPLTALPPLCVLAYCIWRAKKQPKQRAAT